MRDASSQNALGWIMTGRAGAMQEGHRCERAEPRAERCKGNVKGILSITDHGECGEEIPDRAPVRRPESVPAHHRSVEEYVGCVSHGGGGEHACRDPRIDGEVHSNFSAV